MTRPNQQKTLLTLEWSHFWSNNHECCSKCLSWWVLGYVWNWVMWGQKLGHQAKSAENLVNTLAVTFLKQSPWIWLKMFDLMISRSSSKLEHLGSKTRSPGQISVKSYHSSRHFSSNHHESCSKCLSWCVLGQVRNWVTWSQKLGHGAKSAENFVNTLAVIFFKQSSWILLKMFVLMISRSGSKLGHLGSKTRSPGQISRKPC